MSQDTNNLPRQQPKRHELKTDPAVFQAVAAGAKTHEIRFNDRGFAVGDELWLRETVYSGAEMAAGAELLYTSRETLRTVSHIQTGYGLADGWCILSFSSQPVAAPGMTYTARVGEDGEYVLHRGAKVVGELWFYEDADRIIKALAQQAEAAPAPTAEPVAKEQLRELIEGMSVSVDVSTGDHDSGNRLFGTVSEVMDCDGDKHGLTLLVYSAEPNFASPAAHPANTGEACPHCKRLPGDPAGYCDWEECPVGPPRSDDAGNCPACYGEGEIPGAGDAYPYNEPSRCGECNGTGDVPPPSPVGGSADLTDEAVPGDFYVSYGDDAAVDLFAKAMKEKMAASRAKGRGGWHDPDQCSVESLQAMLLEHLAKGDPVDVGNFCMMLWNRDAPVAALASRPAALAAKQIEQPTIYTCIGKGGKYRLLGTATGAGTSNGLEDLRIYIDADNPLDMYYRTIPNFDLRMALASDPQQGERN